MTVSFNPAQTHLPYKQALKVVSENVAKAHAMVSGGTAATVPLAQGASLLLGKLGVLGGVGKALAGFAAVGTGTTIAPAVLATGAIAGGVALVAGLFNGLFAKRVEDVAQDLEAGREPKNVFQHTLDEFLNEGQTLLSSTPEAEETDNEPKKPASINVEA